MKYPRIFFTLSSTLIVAASVYGGSAAARTSYDQCIEGGLGKAECACNFALQKGTVKALQEYLKLYRNADTACNAKASTAKITENSDDDEADGGSNSSSGGSSSAGDDESDGKNNKGFGNGNEGDCQGGGCGDSDNPGNGGGGNGGGNSNH